MQRLVDALTRQADEIAELELGDPQQRADARIEDRVEQRREAARHPRVRIVQPIDLARRDELAEALVQLLHDEAVERDAAVEQPVEGLDAESGDHALAQRLDVVAVGLALDHGSFAEPAAGRQAGERDRDPARAVVAHLQQALDHAEPVRHRPADAAEQFADVDLHDLQVGQRPVALVRLERRAARGCRPARARAARGPAGER